MKPQKPIMQPVISEALQKTLFILGCGAFSGFVVGVFFAVVYLRFWLDILN